MYIYLYSEMIVSIEAIVCQKLVKSWSIVKATYCNKTIISSKLFTTILLILFRNWLHITVRFILGYVVRRLVIIIIIIKLHVKVYNILVCLRGYNYDYDYD